MSDGDVQERNNKFTMLKTRLKTTSIYSYSSSTNLGQPDNNKTDRRVKKVFTTEGVCFLQALVESTSTCSGLQYSMATGNYNSFLVDVRVFSRFDILLVLYSANRRTIAHSEQQQKQHGTGIRATTKNSPTMHMLFTSQGSLIFFQFMMCVVGVENSVFVFFVRLFFVV